MLCRSISSALATTCSPARKKSSGRAPDCLCRRRTRTSIPLLAAPLSRPQQILTVVRHRRLRQPVLAPPQRPQVLRTHTQRPLRSRVPDLALFPVIRRQRQQCRAPLVIVSSRTPTTRLQHLSRSTSRCSRTSSTRQGSRSELPSLTVVK